MARSSSRRNTDRATRKQQQMQQMQQSVIGLFFIGTVLVVLPMFIKNPILQGALGPLRSVGLLMMVAAAAVFGLPRLLRRKPSNFATPEAPSPVAREPEPVPRDTPAARSYSRSRAAPAPEGTSAANDVPQRPTTWSAEVFDLIEWRRFEALCEHLFAQAGFETKSQSHGADEGIDIWLYSRTQPDAAVSLVQCKCWGTRPVKVAEVRALLGSMAAKKVQRGVFATSSRFSPDAQNFAKENGIHTLDRSGLLELIGKRTAAQQAQLLEVATEGEFWKPTCASCGVKMWRRTSSKSESGFWGCVNFPKCRTTLNGT